MQPILGGSSGAAAGAGGAGVAKVTKVSGGAMGVTSRVAHGAGNIVSSII